MSTKVSVNGENDRIFFSDKGVIYTYNPKANKKAIERFYQADKNIDINYFFVNYDASKLILLGKHCTLVHCEENGKRIADHYTENK